MSTQSSPPRRGFGEPTTEAQVRTAKYTNFAALAGLVVLIGTTLYFMFSLSATKKELQASEAMLQIRADSLAAMEARQVRVISELNAYKNALQVRETEARKLLDSITDLALQRDFTTVRKIAVNYGTRSEEADDQVHSPNVNLYSYQAPKQHNLARAFLKDAGYPVLREERMDEMSKWLLDHSIVEYYDEEMAAAAGTIATALQKRLQIKIVPMHSMNLQADAHMHWINVVIVGEAAMEQVRTQNAPYIQMQMEQKR